jgi:ligand-binding SRPBCC domain-containing protein
MPVIRLTTKINAPIETCFDLARSIDLHMAGTEATGERAVGGVTSGLIGLNQEVTWRAKHFGIWQHLTSKITSFDRPSYFRDTMRSGAFRRFDHHHYFEATNGTTIMTDVFDYESPFGLLGKLVDSIFLKRYMERLLRKKNEVLRSAAEQCPEMYLK